MFKEEAAPLARYLGANYNIEEFSLEQPDRARRIRVSMANYLFALLARFQDDHPDAKLYPLTSPYLPEAQWADANYQPGVYQAQCASYVARRALCISGWQAGYLDCGAKVDHEVTRWIVLDDAALVRLMAYLKAEASLEVVGTLSPDDVTGLQLELSTDAEWNGDACTTRSVSGMHWSWLTRSLTMCSLSRGDFPANRQLSCSTAESEVVAPQSRIEVFWTSSAGLGAVVLG